MNEALCAKALFQNSTRFLWQLSDIVFYAGTRKIKQATQDIAPAAMGFFIKK